MEKKKKKENRRENRWDKYFVGRREKREKWWPGYFVSKPTKTSFIYFEVVFLKKLSLSTNKHFFFCCCCRLFLFSSLPLFQFICFGFIYVSFFIISLCLFPYFIFIYDSTVVVFGFLLPFFFPYLSFLSFSLFCFYLSFILGFFF